MTNAEFIAYLVPQAQKGFTDYGIFASVTIAQGCLESAWGTSWLAKNDYNLFGIKYFSASSHDPSINTSSGSTPTDGTGGTYCHYGSWGDSCLDHGYFLKNNSRYTEHGVFTATTPEEQITAIWEAGYATDPDYVSKIMSTINANNLTQYDTGVTPPEDDYGKQVENAIQWMINIANDDTHGYDQDNRWSPDYDCSSFVISGYEQAGIPLKTNGATYTGDMKQVALDTGFHLVDWGNDPTKLVRGDILLNETHHVCCYIGDGKIVQASANENGGAHGGQTGDQTGTEIYIRDFYVYSSGWDCVLRFHDGATGGGTNPQAGEVWTKIIATPYKVNQLSAEQTAFLKTLALGSIVKLKFTFNHNKRQIGQNYLGNKLTFDNKEYKIKDVRNDGYIIVSYGGSVYYKYVNPKYITSIS